MWASALLAVAAAGGEAAEPVPAGVCARLAPQLGLKPRAGAKSPEWRVNMLSGLGTVLFGGSATATFMVEPVAGTTEAQRLDDACQQEKAGLVCTLAGPSAIKVGTKAGTARAELAPGEKAEVALRGRHLTCRDL